MASAVNTKLCTRILYSSRSALTERSVVKVTWLRKQSRSHGCPCPRIRTPINVKVKVGFLYSAAYAMTGPGLYATVLPAAVAGVCLHVDMTAYVFLFNDVTLSFLFLCVMFSDALKIKNTCHTFRRLSAMLQLTAVNTFKQSATATWRRISREYCIPMTT